MQAAQVVEWKQPYKVQEVPIPEPQDFELLLQIKAAGLCHTDNLCALNSTASKKKTAQSRTAFADLKAFLLPQSPRWLSSIACRTTPDWISRTRWYRCSVRIQSQGSLPSG